jgi:N-acetylglucosamine kinase-like BadF-type ATPase
MYVVGIDAGGTKTVCLLADADANVIADARGPGANLHVAGEEGVAAVLRDLGGRVARAAPDVPVAVCVGMAGVDREDEENAVRRILSRVFPGARALVVNDALIALVAGAHDAAGVVIIAGTGSIVYGRSDAAAARAGGWGHMVGDEGSGYWIGREAVTAVMRAGDGRGPLTRLTDEILSHFDVADVSRLPRIVYDREVPRVNVAALGPLVEHAAAGGDPVADGILERAADELSIAASSVVTRLGMRGDAFTFFLAGGAFQVVPSLEERLSRRLIELAPRAAVRRLEAEPAAGAVWLALAQARGEVRLPRYKAATA